MAVLSMSKLGRASMCQMRTWAAGQSTQQAQVATGVRRPSALSVSLNTSRACGCWPACRLSSCRASGKPIQILRDQKLECLQCLYSYAPAASQMETVRGVARRRWQEAMGSSAELAGGAIRQAGAKLDSLPTSPARFLACERSVAALIGRGMSCQQTACWAQQRPQQNPCRPSVPSRIAPQAQRPQQNPRRPRCQHLWALLCPVQELPPCPSMACPTLPFADTPAAAAGMIGGYASAHLARRAAAAAWCAACG